MFKSKNFKKLLSIALACAMMVVVSITGLSSVTYAKAEDGIIFLSENEDGTYCESSKPRTFSTQNLSVKNDIGEIKENTTDSSEFLFFDVNGLENKVIVHILNRGAVEVEYYLDGELNNIVNTILREDGNVEFSLFDYNENVKSDFVEPISKYIKNSDNISAFKDKNEPNRDLSSFNYEGKIYYNTFLDQVTVAPINNSLNIYVNELYTNYEFKTINAEAGTLASLGISVLAAILTILVPPLGVAVSSSLFAAALYAGGSFVVGGIVQKSISEDYWVKSTDCDVKAIDHITNRERIYDGEKYNIALSDGSYYAESEYEGYLPWASTAVAYWIYCDFWDHLTYPGVQRYYVI